MTIPAPDPTGRFRFPWLRRGTYRVYTISECDDYENCTEGIYETAVIDDEGDRFRADHDHRNF